ncbi:L,D-transpeptidase family protein [Roseibium aquae]|nr:murein L,D-transpeptidase family protein [Roseibium aquae]
MASIRFPGLERFTAMGAAVRQILRRGVRPVAVALLAAGVLAGCQADELGYGPKHKRPVSSEIKHKMAELNMSPGSPIMIRIFKQENELEVWKRARTGRFELLESFEICKWSGELGPKFKEGDRQAPEGFYEITPGLMNPNSSYHLAFNLGFPNKFDQAHGRTGSHLMVHGACSSRGCYAMTDAQVQDIFALARDSFAGGQRSFQVQAFPFRMTPENMVKHRDSEHFEYWQMLKEGYDHFEVTRTPPNVEVCDRRYVFDPVPLVEGVPFRATAQCPAFKKPERVEQLVAAKQRRDQEEFQQIVARIEAREEREQRWEERQKAIAGLLTIGGGAEQETAGPDTPAQAPAGASVAVAEALEPAQPQQRPGSAVETAFAAPSQSVGSRTTSFFSRLIPFGGSDDTAAAAAVAGDAVGVVPAPKPLN